MAFFKEGIKRTGGRSASEHRKRPREEDMDAAEKPPIPLTGMGGYLVLKNGSEAPSRRREKADSCRGGAKSRSFRDHAPGANGGPVWGAGTPPQVMKE